VRAQFRPGEQSSFGIGVGPGTCGGAKKESKFVAGFLERFCQGTIKTRTGGRKIGGEFAKRSFKPSREGKLARSMKTRGEHNRMIQMEGLEGLAARSSKLIFRGCTGGRRRMPARRRKKKA